MIADGRRTQCWVRLETRKHCEFTAVSVKCSSISYSADKMTNTLVIFCCLALASAIAKPATNDQLDKATVNDVAANAVSPDKKAEEGTDKKDAATVQITGITTGIEIPEQPPSTTFFHPQRAGSMFARFIDDIFQIPINVLQNVARLITTPFQQTKKTPEESATA